MQNALLNNTDNDKYLVGHTLLRKKQCVPVCVAASGNLFLGLLVFGHKSSEHLDLFV